MKDEGDMVIPHFVADNISWWHPVDPKTINSAILQRENQSLSFAILDLDVQIQNMEDMLHDFGPNYVSINNPQSEVETRMDEFLTDVRNSSNIRSDERLRPDAQSPGARPASHLRQACPHPYYFCS